MADFREYQHIEKYGNDEVEGIELGTCYIFPKIDGTNGSIWINEAGILQCGSRHRVLSLDHDNQGFMHYVDNHVELKNFVYDHRLWTVYGEWLVPHTLKTYRGDTWRRFYIFDIWDSVMQRYLGYDEYKPILDFYHLDYIPCSCIMQNTTYANLLHELYSNTFLIETGKGIGEGIVIKNYQFKNKWGRTTWAKVIHTAFKDALTHSSTPTKIFTECIEEQICIKYIDKALVSKVYAKIVNEREGWNSRYIPELLSTVYHDFITEELWDILKQYKNPKIDFKRLNQITINTVKTLLPELF